MALLDSKIYAIIPARGGSKRIPDKNIIDFLGSPLISYSIKTAIKSKLFSEVFVSTDSAKISQISQDFGAKVPFLRSSHLSDDFTPTLDVVEDFILRYGLDEESLICCLYPTAPLLTPQTLLQAHSMLTPQTHYVFGATQYSFSPFRSFSYANQRLQLLFPKHQNTRSQDLEPIYHDAGQFYIGSAKTFLQKLPIFSPSSVPFILSNMQVQDIDTLEDLELTKLKYQLLS